MPQGVLSYKTNGETAEITGYRGKDTEIAVPTVAGGCPVTCIGKKAFLSNKLLKEISLPESVVRIDDWAFAYCAKLARVILPYHRMEIGQGIFRDCFCWNRLWMRVQTPGRKRPQTQLFFWRPL